MTFRSLLVPLVAAVMGVGLSWVSAEAINRYRSIRASDIVPNLPEDQWERFLSPTSIQVGEAWAGATYELAFDFLNSLDHSVQIKGVRATCGCASASAVGGTVSPNESITVPINLHPVNKRGPFTHAVRLLTDDPNIASLRFKIYGSTVGSITTQDSGEGRVVDASIGGTLYCILNMEGDLSWLSGVSIEDIVVNSNTIQVVVGALDTKFLGNDAQVVIELDVPPTSSFGSHSITLTVPQVGGSDATFNTDILFEVI